MAFHNFQRAAGLDPRTLATLKLAFGHVPWKLGNESETRAKTRAKAPAGLAPLGNQFVPFRR